MTLRRPGTAAQAPTEAPQQTTPQQESTNAPEQNTAPTALAPRSTTAVSTGKSAGKLADFHAQSGVVLEGIEEWNLGNYVTMDGSEFYIKSLEKRVTELTIIPSYAKQFYYWHDEANNIHHEEDKKLDDRYSMKIRLEWMDYIEGEEEPQKFIFTMPTASAMQFREYVQKLRDEGTPLGSVWTHITITREEKKIDGKTVRFSKAKFTKGEPVQYEE